MAARPIRIAHRVPPPELALGVVVLEGLAVAPAAAPLVAALEEQIARRRAAPLSALEEQRRQASREMLRRGRYKPTGRGKPASEYLVRAAGEGELASINLVVDACNATSLASGIPISVVDLDRARAPFRLALAPEGARYVFNSSGQEIDVSGLLCLWDAEGPTANAVKDAMRTKTGEATRRTLSVLWGARGFEAELERATAWYRELLERAGAKTQTV